jgi:hypothetical protein
MMRADRAIANREIKQAAKREAMALSYNGAKR